MSPYDGIHFDSTLGPVPCTRCGVTPCECPGGDPDEVRESTAVEFTPGPWEVDDGDTDAFGVFARGAAVCYLSTYPGDGFGLAGREEDEANAHLIAAAPDLLTAAEAAFVWFDQEPGADDAERAGEVYEILRAAIRKARGEEAAE